MNRPPHFRTKSPSISYLPRSRVVLLGALLVLSIVICSAEETNKEQEQDQQLSEQPNRQSFKVHLISGNKATGSKKLLPRLKAARQQQQQQISLSGGGKSDPTDRATAGADGDEPIKGANKGQEKQSKQKGTTISSATLKKLLNQTLLKAPSNNASGSSMAADFIANPGQKTSKNFKFVFIQRAAAATAASPQPGKSANPPATSPSPPTSPGEQQLSSSSSPPPLESASKPSLAASVSKQLATSLLSSAAGLVANLGSSSSLSSLASQIVAASAGANSSPPTTGRNNSTASTSDLSAESSETNRREQQQQVDSNETGAVPKKAATIRKATKPSKASKIYNLPVKFVANGQPNHVLVFHTLKEHFATIKRLKAGSANGTGAGNGAGTKTTNSIRPNKERKQQKHRLTGTNSRLIYLPLRYLSNAKPNKILITRSSGKVTHKS